MGEFGPDALADIVTSISDTQQRRATSRSLPADELGSGGYLSARSQRPIWRDYEGAQLSSPVYSWAVGPFFVIVTLDPDTIIVYADDVTDKPKPQLRIEKIREGSVQLSSLSWGVVLNLSSTFAEHRHRPTGDPETATVKTRLNLIRRGPMASKFKTEHGEAVTYALKVIQAAARQLAVLDVKFPVVLDALVKAHASAMAFDKLETSHSLYQSSLDFALAHRINAEVRLRDLNIPEPEVRLLQKYLIKNPGALAERAANSVAE
jgi:hypothetical protein